MQKLVSESMLVVTVRTADGETSNIAITLELDGISDGNDDEEGVCGNLVI